MMKHAECHARYCFRGAGHERYASSATVKNTDSWMSGQASTGAIDVEPVIGNDTADRSFN